MATNQARPDLLARDLARLLNDLAGLHGEMAGQMRDKFVAIRQADSERIQSITASEMALALRVAEREGLRRQITRRIIEALGLSRRVESVRLNELAGWFREPRRGELMNAASSLRRQVEGLQRQQQINALITQEMVRHLGEVMAVMRGGLSAESYSRRGRREQQAAASVFEAVG